MVHERGFGLGFPVDTSFRVHRHYPTGSLHCRQYIPPLSDWLSTLSAAYAAIVWLALYTVGSIWRHCLIGSLHCPAYVAIVWLARYNFGSIWRHCMTDPLHCRQFFYDAVFMALWVSLAVVSEAWARLVDCHKVQQVKNMLILSSIHFTTPHCLISENLFLSIT